MIAENTRVKRAEDDMKAKYPLCNTKWDAKSVGAHSAEVSMSEHRANRVILH